MTPEDIPAIAALRRRSFRLTQSRSNDELERYFRRIFFDNPWYTPDLPSLLWENNGEILAFLGVLPRTFRLGDQRLSGAVTTQFMVAEEVRGGVIGSMLIRATMAGPQDILMADVANETAQRMWYNLGGSIARIYSLFWRRTVRPARAAALSLGDSLAESVVRQVARPILNATDNAVAAVRRNVYRAPAGSTKTITTAAIADNLHSFATDSLHADYSDQSLAWLMENVRQKWPQAGLHVRGAHNEAGELIGWFIYVVTSRGEARVLQLVARPSDRSLVLQHLLHDCRRAGAARVNGRIEPLMVDELIENRCKFEYGGRGVLVHAKSKSLLQHVLAGEATLSGLEGEWWLAF